MSNQFNGVSAHKSYNYCYNIIIIEYKLKTKYFHDCHRKLNTNLIIEYLINFYMRKFEIVII